MDSDLSEVHEHASVYVMDEISSLSLSVQNAAYNAVKKFKKKTSLIIGDKNQIAAVVKSGTRQQICQASFYCSKHMTKLEKNYFSANLRLQNITDPIQERYDKMTSAIGDGTYNIDENLSIEELLPKPDVSCSTRLAFLDTC